jgi:hypothetical protein
MFAGWQQGFGYFISFRDAVALFIIILVAVLGAVIMRRRQMRKGRRP